MDQRTVKLLFALLRSAICGTMLTDKEREEYSPELFNDLLKISSKHDVAHLLALGLKQNGLILKEQLGIEKSIHKAVYRYEQLNYEYKSLCDIFELANIPFVPLKGSVIRKYYPQAWMRTSSDIDILVHEEDLEKASTILIDEHGYRFYKKFSHDISLFSPANTHIELHYTLVDDGVVKGSSAVLDSVWENVAVREGYNYLHEMSDEMFYFYHIAHMAKHFEYGGCGIRPFVDLWILDNIKDADHTKRNKLLEQGNFLKFAQAARKLSRIWLENAQGDLISQQMEDYILRGGVYGTVENYLTVQHQKKGGRIKYALYKIFVPYDVIKFQYPVLQKHRWLTPFMEVRRWCNLIFCGHAKRIFKQFKYSQTISKDSIDKTKDFLINIGLQTHHEKDA